MKDSITWKIGGEAGFGIMSAGTIFAKVFTRNGYHAFVLNEYPSLIRGGHNLVTVRVSTDKFFSLTRELDIVVALNKETVSLHLDEFTDETLLVFDPNDYAWKQEEFTKKVTLLPVPLTELNKTHGGEPIMRNTIALAVTVALMGIDFSLLEAVIGDVFKKKGPEVIAHNVGVAKTGFDFIKATYPAEARGYINKTTKKEDLLLVNGSEALGIGAVRAGLKFAAVYPMTPINAVITFLADHAKNFDLVYKQPEDEIAGITMAIGASVSGVRSMVATSGGGFALMVEGLSLAGMIEVPLVIDLGMRVGPATGMPTWTEQGELQFAIHAGHGEFARIIFAPGDAEEAYTLTIDAFELADQFQIPVFVLTDKYLNESQWCVPKSSYITKAPLNRGKLLLGQEIPETPEYKRYTLDAPDGVSARSVPGMKHGFYYANSYEHDETGHVTEKAEMRKAMVERRLRKASAIHAIAKPPKVYGDTSADICFVSWGSTKGPILEAMDILKKQNIPAKLLHFTWMYPFPQMGVLDVLTNAKHVIDIEQNATAQLVSLIREHTGFAIEKKLLKYDGRPLYPEEIVSYVLQSANFKVQS